MCRKFPSSIRFRAEFELFKKSPKQTKIKINKQTNDKDKTEQQKHTQKTKLQLLKFGKLLFEWGNFET